MWRWLWPAKRLAAGRQLIWLAAGAGGAAAAGCSEALAAASPVCRRGGSLSPTESVCIPILFQWPSMASVSGYFIQLFSTNIDWLQYVSGWLFSILFCNDYSVWLNSVNIIINLSMTGYVTADTG